MQLDLYPHKESLLINQTQFSTQIKLNQEKERKEVFDMLTPYSQQGTNKRFKLRKPTNESPSTSGFTHESIRSKSNVLISFIFLFFIVCCNNSLEDNSRDVNSLNSKNQMVLSARLPEMMINRLIPKVVYRPLSNLHFSSHCWNESVMILITNKHNSIQNNKRIKICKGSDNTNSKEISRGDNKRPQLGTAPCKEYMINDRSTQEQNRLSNIRPLHKIKIGEDLLRLA